MPLIVAIDGPAGAGKSTVARQVALMLQLTYLDTGAMYRSVAWKVGRQQLDAEDTEALTRLAENLRVSFGPLTPDGRQSVTVDGDDVTEAIRTPEISQQTSALSARPEVRRVVVAQQRALAALSRRGVVLEGRDIGTVVFPDAKVKIFLTASAEERARRRLAELHERGMEADYAQTLAEMVERDARDTQRAHSPLTPAPDAVLLDTDGLSVETIVAQIVARCRPLLDSLDAA